MAVPSSRLRDSAQTYRCSNVDACTEAFVTMRAGLRSMSAAERRSDRAVRATGLPAACKSVLVTPAAGYARHRRLDAILGRLAEALRAQSARDLRAAAQAARRLAVSRRPADRQLARFRAACR